MLTRREFVRSAAVVGAAAVGGNLAGCASPSSHKATGEAAAQPEQTAQPQQAVPPSEEQSSPKSTSPDGAIVYFTPDISPKGLAAIYQAVGRQARGKVGVKISTGEAGGRNYLKPELIGELVQAVNGTILECNTAYGGSRSTTQAHLAVAAEHGFTAIADVDIMDANGEVALPVAGGKHLSEDYVGATFPDYDFVVNLAHFKGHAMGGFGGVVKNASIGMASADGKRWIHSAGTSKDSWSSAAQDDFLESMAEAAKAVADHLGDNVVYLDVMNNLSVDCDCDSNPAKPEMADIGILGSTDPVALDKACMDLVYAAKDGQALIERIESRNGAHTLDYAEQIGLGTQSYRLVEV
ncbi:DUF362 domain-containing protein [Eggerthellaceae bacterium zg-893]|nr:DUF362 domain-containing protein [Eggerthellaceae bacterium zg-893]